MYASFISCIILASCGPSTAFILIMKKYFWGGGLQNLILSSAKSSTDPQKTLTNSYVGYAGCWKHVGVFNVLGGGEFGQCQNLWMGPTKSINCMVFAIILRISILWKCWIAEKFVIHTENCCSRVVAFSSECIICHMISKFYPTYKEIIGQIRYHSHERCLKFEKMRRISNWRKFQILDSGHASGV